MLCIIHWCLVVMTHRCVQSSEFEQVLFRWYSVRPKLLVLTCRRSLSSHSISDGRTDPGIVKTKRRHQTTDGVVVRPYRHIDYRLLESILFLSYSQAKWCGGTSMPGSFHPEDNFARLSSFRVSPSGFNWTGPSFSSLVSNTFKSVITIVTSFF